MLSRLSSMSPARLGGSAAVGLAAAAAVTVAVRAGRRAMSSGGRAGGSFDPSTFDAEAYRKHAHEMVDFIADYYKTLGDRPVLPSVEPGYLKKALPRNAPEDPEHFDAIMEDVRRHIMPGVTNWQSPNFFAYFPANSSPPAMIGDMLSAGLNVIGFSWITSPACTELETITLDWLGRMMGLPEAFTSDGKGGGVIQGTASEATATALLAARARALAQHGDAAGPRLVVYGSDQSHSSVKKACMIAGLGPQAFRAIPARKERGYAVDPADVAAAIDADLKDGKIPVMLCATLGTTSSCAVDPLRPLGALCRDHGLWLHVDAAYAGSAMICPEYQHLLDGVELADSIATNPHKWLLTNFDSCTMWVRDRSYLIDALTVQPEYLRNKASESGLVVDYKDWQIPLGRKFRSLKLWFVLRSYGRTGLQNYIRGHVALARRFGDCVAQDPRFELAAPVAFGLVCFRLRGATREQNEKLLDSINSGKDIFMIHSVVGGEYILRFAVGSPQTTPDHVDRAWATVQRHAATVLAAAAT